MEIEWTSGLALSRAAVECEVAGEWYRKEERGIWSWADKDCGAARRSCSEFECAASSLLSGGAEFGISARA